ncbi:MAG: hypothetical protein ABI539_05040 [Acidobacteriota bacterium]
MRSTLVLIVLLMAHGSYAQQTVFNVPRTEDLSRGQVCVELDAAFQPKGQAGACEGDHILELFDLQL